MKQRSRIAVLGFLLTVCALLIAARQSGALPPDELISMDFLVGTSGKGPQTELKQSWYNFSTRDQSVAVKRRSRSSANVPWNEQVQELSTSFYPVDVRAVCGQSHEIGELFVTGAYPDGESCVERWVFEYKHGLGLGGGGSALPQVVRTELFRGSQLGHIRCLEPDPDGRFVLLLTYETPVLYRLALPGGQISVELDSTAVPALATAKHIYTHQLVTGARLYSLGERGRREHGPIHGSDVTLLLADSNNDGILEAPELLTVDEWDARYPREVFVALCP